MILIAPRRAIAAARCGAFTVNFRVKITAAANETFEAWRERDHDDLVLALVIAVWYAERDNIDYDEEPFGVLSPGRRCFT